MIKSPVGRTAGQLRPERTLEESGLADGSKLMLVGSTDTEVQLVQEAHAAAAADAKRRGTYVSTRFVVLFTFAH